MYKKFLKDITSMLLLIAIVLFSPLYIIYLIYSLANGGTILGFKLPFIPISFEDIKVSEYMAMYVGLIGSEVAAILTYSIYNSTTINERKREKQIKEEKITLSRQKVYNDLVDSLNYFFEWYLSYPNEHPKHFPICDGWDDLILNLDLDEKDIGIYKDLYRSIDEINTIMEKGKYPEAIRSIEQFYLKVSMEFYSVYHLQIGKQITINSILKPSYIKVIKNLSPFGNGFKQSFKYKNGNTLYTVDSEIFTVYNEDGSLLCKCSFKNKKPFDGYAKLFKKTILWYDGHFKNGLEICGTYYSCLLDENGDLKGGMPLFASRFKPTDVIANSSKTYVKVADVALRNNEYIIEKHSIKTGIQSVI